MAEYIEREAVMREKLLDTFHEYNARYVTFCDSCFKDSAEELNSKMLGLADCLISNDVAPVVHGRWIRYEGEDDCECSVCLHWFCVCKSGKNVTVKNAHYCPNCGCKMDGGTNE